MNLEKLKDNIDTWFHDSKEMDKLREHFDTIFAEENRLINEFKAKSNLEKIEFIKDAISNDDGNAVHQVWLYAMAYGRAIDDHTTTFSVYAYSIDEISTNIEMLIGQGTAYKIYSDKHNFNSVLG